MIASSIVGGAIPVKFGARTKSTNLKLLFKI